MSINLNKGESINLTKERPELTEVTVGLGWGTQKYKGKYDFDLDASAFLLGSNGKVRSDSDFLFYGNKTAAGGAVIHTGDDRAGNDSNDDAEQIIVRLDRIPADVYKIAFVVTIYDAPGRNQNFGQVSNAYVHLIDSVTNNVLLEYKLTEEYGIETAMIVCELERVDDNWKFNAIGEGSRGGLAGLCGKYGIDANAENH